MDKAVLIICAIFPYCIIFYFLWSGRRAAGGGVAAGAVGVRRVVVRARPQPAGVQLFRAASHRALAAGRRRQRPARDRELMMAYCKSKVFFFI